LNFGFWCVWFWFFSRNECYKLDSFFDQEDNNVGQIFEREVSPMIPAIFGGCNATVFAYGATGSGKTYTMQVRVWSVCLNLFNFVVKCRFCLFVFGICRWESVIC